MKLIGNAGEVFRKIGSYRAAQPEDSMDKVQIKRDAARVDVTSGKTSLSRATADAISGRAGGPGIKPNEALLSEGAAVTSQEVADLSDHDKEQIEAFFKEDKSSDAQKGQAVRVAMKKGVELTSENLSAVRSALSGDQSLIEPESEGSDRAAAIKKASFQSAQGADGDLPALIGAIEKALRNAGAGGGRMSADQSGMMAVVTTSSGSFAISAETSRLASAMILGAFDGMEDGLAALLGGDGLSITQDGSGALGDESLQRLSAVKAGLEKLVEDSGMPMDIETGTDDTQTSHVADTIVENVMKSLQDSVWGTAQTIGSPSFRQIVRIETTGAMVKAKEEFAALKRDIGNEAARVQAQDGKAARESIRTSLEKAIDRLDSFIMKSDSMMYMSMGNEKSLLVQSSVLESARRSLQSGDLAKAKAMLEGVSRALGSIDFQPSHRRAELMVTSKMERHMGSGNSEPHYSRLRAMNELRSEEKSSARAMGEVMRSLGLNNEFETSETFERLSDRSDIRDRISREGVQDNLKAALIKMQGEDSSREKLETVGKAIETIFGAQLLNKEEAHKQESVNMFIVPMNDGKSEARVMVNARKNGGIIDSDNCSLYFSFETGRLGVTGVKLTISGGALNMDVYNDSARFREKLEACFGRVAESFGELSLRKGYVRVSAFDESGDLASAADRSAPMAAEVNPHADGRIDIKL